MHVLLRQTWWLWLAAGCTAGPHAPSTQLAQRTTRLTATARILVNDQLEGVALSGSSARALLAYTHDQTHRLATAVTTFGDAFATDNLAAPQRLAEGLHRVGERELAGLPRLTSPTGPLTTLLSPARLAAGLTRAKDTAWDLLVVNPVALPVPEDHDAAQGHAPGSPAPTLGDRLGWRLRL